MAFEAGQASWKDLIKGFGIEKIEDAGRNFNADMMEGEKGDGTFQLGDSDTAYLTEETWEKNRNSDKTWDAYANVYGQEAADKKREGNEDGLSASAFDGLMDKLYEGGKEEEIAEIAPSFNEAKFSPQVQEAMERSQAYRERNWSQEVYGKSNELAKQSKFYQEPGDESNNGAQMAADSATDAHFNEEKYKQDYSAEYVA